MTTHDMQPEMSDQTVRADRPADSQRIDPPRESADTTGDFANPMQTREAPAETYETPDDNFQPADDNFQAPAETGQAPAASHAAPVDTAGSSEAGTSDAMLFADGELSDMHARWVEVQSAFVDDPRDCVQKADGLVADVVDKLTTSFSGARAHLEEQWSRGEEVSTEDLRIALKRYREFFERLLAV
jgi:hypothetical protein